MVRICLDLPPTALEEASKNWQTCASVVCGVWERSYQKLTKASALMTPAAQMPGWPRTMGDGRLRARAAASSRQSTAHSASRCAWQKASVCAMTAVDTGNME